ncbi:hypothetical protein BT3_178 [Staphylococcus phage BT3]|uniref:Uncharacterized protein n=1 Tax=Staphylococcus phage MCE-2014 TaxID=1524910 RepID=A0A076G454_9CAUD|nr:hypothetical protein OZ71_gp171 [Staphylococcus phage MCE-2014]AUV57003.1 hypothetical protein LM12_0055 [Staphylococcus phage vB_SauM_LM12]QVD58139.1 hypothetical protein BT3_178 [Staphylococcus phage BT3]WLY86810.1 hypothetical protein 355Saur083PP_00043 [Staphylococcus phage 355Saur083PP]WPH66849.1 hypothetical protein CUBA_gp161 [Staphylococcus phage CUB-A]VEV88285.1 hypothetical protein [Staphylococcus phage Stab20]
MNILVIHYEETNKRVLKETIKTIQNHLNDEHGLVKMTATRLSRKAIEEEFKDYNIVIAENDPDSFYSYSDAVDDVDFVIDIPISYLDIHAGVEWDVDNPVDMLDRNPDFIEAMGQLNEDLML